MSISPPSAEHSSVRRSGYLIIVLLFVAEAVSAFESSTVYMALPRLGEVFGASPSDTQWVATSYMLSAAACVVLAGRLGDMYGRKRVLVILLVISVAGSFISAFADSLGVVIAGRAIQGIAAATLPLCLGLARELLPAKLVSLGIASVSGSALFFGALGTAVSGVVLDHADWHWLFLIAAIGGIVTTLIVMVMIPRDTSLDRSAKPDWLGATLMPLGVTFALLAVSNGNARGWTSSFVLACGASGVVLLACWWAWQLRARSPLFDVRLLRRRDLGFAYLINAFVALGALGLAVVVPGILQAPTVAPVGFGLSASVAGYVASFGAFAGAAAALFSSSVTRRFGPERTVQLCTISLFVGVAGMGLFMHWLPGFIVMNVLQSMGIGLAFAGISSYVVASIAAEQTGQAAGFSSLMRTSFNAVSSGVIGTVLAIGVVAGSRFSASWAYIAIFSGCSLILLAAFILAATLPKRTFGETKPQHESAMIAVDGQVGLPATN